MSEKLFNNNGSSLSFFLLSLFADMQNFFGSINHQCLREFLDLRIKDGVIRKMIDKCFQAGVLDNGQFISPSEGTPQEGTISPLISN
jgi:RNA-directed DNA polymerase